MKWYQLEFPRALEADDVTAFLRSLAARRRQGLVGTALPVVFEVESRAGKLAWYLGMHQHEERAVRTAFQHHLPSVGLTSIDRARPQFTRGVELRLHDARRPLRTDVAKDAARVVLSALQLPWRGEALCIQWLVGPWLRRRVVHPAPAKPKPGSPLSLEWTRPSLDSEQARALKEKQREPVFGVVARIAVRARRRQRQQHLLRQVLGALQVVRQPGVGFRRRLISQRAVPRRLDALQQPWVSYPNALSATELASVLAWPIDGPVLPGVSYRGHRQLPPAVGAVTRQPGVQRRVTGEITYPGIDGYLQLPAAEAVRSLHVVGPIGVGKSTLLGNLCLSDISAGRGVVLLDPKGDLVNEVVARIPAERVDDVVLLDPTDRDYSLGFNPLRAGEPEVAVDGIMHVLHAMYAAYWGPRSQDIFHAGLLTLARQPDYTLCDLPTLLTNESVRRQVTRGLPKDDAAGLWAFWQWFGRMSEAERSVVTGPVLNKLRNFSLRAAIRGVIGQSTGFELARVLTERKVLLVNLSSGSLGPETANLLGALLIGQLWQAIQARSAIAPERRHGVFIYADEFQNFVKLPTDLGNALVMSRSAGVGWVLAHQHLGQLDKATREAVLGNARSRVVFQAGHDDATSLARQLGGGLTPEDITGLGPFETYQALSVGGVTVTPASARTLPLPPPTGQAERVIRHSRQAFAMRRVDVEAELALRRRSDDHSEAPIGVKPRASGGEK